MTPREIIIKNIETECDDRIGFNFINGNGRNNDFIDVGLRDQFESLTKRWQEGQTEFYTDFWGNTWQRKIGKSEGGEIFKPILQSWDDLDNLELPDLDNPKYYKKAQQVGENEKQLFRLGRIPAWPFASCRDMRKMEIYFMDLIAHREKTDILHDRVTTLLEGVIDQFGQAGMDGVFFCEDLGVQDRLLMAPEMWRDIFRPLYERLTGIAHKYGMKVIQHSCGYNWDLVDDLCQSGIDCLQFDQPAIYDIPALAEKLKKYRVGLHAPCDIQAVLPTANKDIIQNHIKILIDNFRGSLIAKDYPDLNGIGVKPEVDQIAYEIFCDLARQ